LLSVVDTAVESVVAVECSVVDESNVVWLSPWLQPLVLLVPLDPPVWWE
jgi:hypothetical protein